LAPPTRRRLRKKDSHARARTGERGLARVLGERASEERAEAMVDDDYREKSRMRSCARGNVRRFCFDAPIYALCSISRTDFEFQLARDFIEKRSRCSAKLERF
jgi:hypothetical protein